MRSTKLLCLWILPAHCPKARTETDTNSIGRITAELRKQDLAVSKKKFGSDETPSTTAKYAGMKFGDYGLLAATTCSAIFQLDKDTQKQEFFFAELPSLENRYAELNEDIFLALKRLAVVTAENETPYVTMTFWKDTQEIEITAQSEDKTFYGREIVSAYVHRTGVITIDPEKLLVLLGVWPMGVYIPEDSARAITLAPTFSAEFLTVLAPVNVPAESKDKVA